MLTDGTTRASPSAAARDPVVAMVPVSLNGTVPVSPRQLRPYRHSIREPVEMQMTLETGAASDGGLERVDAPASSGPRGEQQRVGADVRTDVEHGRALMNTGLEGCVFLARSTRDGGSPNRPGTSRRRQTADQMIARQRRRSIRGTRASAARAARLARGGPNPKWPARASWRPGSSGRSPSACQVRPRRTTARAIAGTVAIHPRPVACRVHVRRGRGCCRAIVASQRS